MTTIAQPPKDYPPEITGYVEPWIANPGDTVQVKVGATESALCRIMHPSKKHKPSSCLIVLGPVEGFPSFT